MAILTLTLFNRNKNEKTTNQYHAAIPALTAGLAGCIVGEMVKVPPASIGMVLGEKGYQTNSVDPDIQPVSPRTQTLPGFVPLKP